MRLKLTALIVTLALGLLAVPLPAETQKAGKVYKVGVLRPSYSTFRLQYPSVFPDTLPFYLQWLSQLGYVEGQNIRFEHRGPVGSDQSLAEVVADLVRLNVDVIVAEGTPAIRAAKQATKTIPIVMVADGDPVRAGLVASLARPGGNITGVTALVPELNGKRLELLKEAIPVLRRLAILWNPAYANRANEWNAMQAAAQALGVELQSLEVRSRDDFKSAFEAAIRDRAGALLVLGDPLIFAHARGIAVLAMKSRLPAIYSHWSFVMPRGYGGLMSYGADDLDLAERVSSYINKILKGAKPADLPVERPTRFELWINLKTAKALGLTIPASVLFRADRVIR
ncbi:MAG: ABC transporter substrate-binding protein [Candidatus Methylomirabilales bacterium]